MPDTKTGRSKTKVLDDRVVHLELYLRAINMKTREEQNFDLSSQKSRCREIVSGALWGFDILTYEQDEDRVSLSVKMNQENIFPGQKARKQIIEIFGDAASDTWMEGDITIHPDPDVEDYSSYVGWDYSDWPEERQNELCELFIDLSKIRVEKKTREIKQE